MSTLMPTPLFTRPSSLNFFGQSAPSILTLSPCLLQLVKWFLIQGIFVISPSTHFFLLGIFTLDDAHILIFQIIFCKVGRWLSHFIMIGPQDSLLQWL